MTASAGRSPALRADIGRHAPIIEPVETLALRAPLGRRFSGSAYSMDNRRTIVTRLTTADGVTSDAYTGDTDAEHALMVDIIHDELAPWIIGRSASDPDGGMDRDGALHQRHLAAPRASAPDHRLPGRRDLERLRAGPGPDAPQVMGDHVFVECFDDERAPFFRRLFDMSSRIADGTYSLPERPGFGIQLDLDYVERHAVDRRTTDRRSVG